MQEEVYSLYHLYCVTSGSVRLAWPDYAMNVCFESVVTTNFLRKLNFMFWGLSVGDMRSASHACLSVVTVH
jgi:hypothetical protein